MSEKTLALIRAGRIPKGDVMATATVAVVFADEIEVVRETLIANKDQLNLPGVLWVAYPRTETNRVDAETLKPVLIEFGMRPDGQVEIDTTWFGLRLRPVGDGESPFSD